MSQAVQRGVVMLTILLVLSIGIAIFEFVQLKDLQVRNQSLQNQVTSSQAKQKDALLKADKLQKDANDLTQKLADSDKEKEQLQGSFDELKKKADDLAAQIDQANKDRDEYKSRVETVRKERDDLMAKLQNQPEKIVYKDRPVEAAPATPAPAAAVESTPTPDIAQAPASGTPEGDAYWAKILRAKAALEVQLNKANQDLNNDALQVADLKKQNSDLQIEIKNLTNDKEDIERRLTQEKKELEANFDRERQEMTRKIKDQEDLANNLSMETTRARGDQKNANDFVSKIKEDNSQMQSQMRQLISTKVALEKTVARLMDEKSQMATKLSETEGVIQNRINEIWQIKKNLDQKITQMDQLKANSQEVELPPIVVSANGQNSGDQAQGAPHKIISINEKNNFVIVDWGQTQGSSIGRILKVYRNKEQVATLEVIQVRRDISAADIKDQKTQLQVGDQVQ